MLHLLPLESNQQLPSGHTPLYWLCGEQQGIMGPLYLSVGMHKGFLQTSSLQSVKMIPTLSLQSSSYINCVDINKFSPLQTGDKSSEVTARMNLSDLRLVVGLKSKSNFNPNIFYNTNTNSSALTGSFQGYPNLSGTSAVLRTGCHCQDNLTNPFILEHEAICHYSYEAVGLYYFSMFSEKS